MKRTKLQIERTVLRILKVESLDGVRAGKAAGFAAPALTENCQFGDRASLTPDCNTNGSRGCS